MKKLISLVIAALMLVSLCSCGVERVDIDFSNNTQPSAVVEESGSDGFEFIVNGTSVTLGEETSLFMDKIGESEGYFEEPSCASDGIDRIYFYKSYQICCYPDGASYYVYSITLLDDTVSTAEGLCIGDSYEKMIELYGDEPDISGINYSYQKGNSQIQFTVEDDSVKGISYFIILG